MDIRGALEARKAAQDAATNAAAKGGQADAQASGRALQLAGAQQAVTAAHRNAAKQIASAQRQVIQAQQGVRDAEVQASEQRRAAIAKVVDAQQGVRDAVQQAAVAQEQAARRVQDAERQLAQAQVQARQAQVELTDARRQAKRELADLNAQVAGAALDERSATLRVTEALRDLQRTKSDPKADQLARDQAQLSYDQAVQQLSDQRRRNKELRSDVAAANKAGVDGSGTVRRAQDQVTSSQQRVAEAARGVRDAEVEASRTRQQAAANIAKAQRAVADAQANVVRVQQDGASKIAAAEQRVADARRGVAEAQQQAAETIAGAQRQLQQAQLAGAKSADQAAVAQAKYQAALAKMTPATRQTFNALLSLSTAFKAWSRSLQPAIMPIFTRAINGLKASLPGLTPFVLAAARAITILQNKASAGFKSPGWQQFKADLAGSVLPAIVGLGVAFGNIFKGMGGAVQAFLPHMNSIAVRMAAVTGRFANWGTSLKGSPAFEAFLAYSARMAPVLGKALGDIIVALSDMGRAVAPMSGPLLAVLGTVARAFSAIANHVPGLIQLMYALFVATRLWTIAQIAGTAALVVYRAAVVLATLLTQGWTAAIIVANAAFAGNPVVAIVKIIIVALVLLTAAVLYAWKHWGWFRAAVIGAWTGIKIAALAVWNYGLKPAFEAIVIASKAVGNAAVWLWRTILLPAFRGISLAARILFAIVVVAVITPWVIAFRLVAAVATWLWRTILVPVFRGIATIATWLWKYFIKPHFTAMIAIFRLLATVGAWLWKTILVPVFRGIAAVVTWLWRTIIRPQFNAMMTIFRALAKVGVWLWKTILAPVFRGIGSVATWLWKNAIKPAFSGIASLAKWLWEKALRPAFNAMKAGVKAVGVGFSKAKDAIKWAWDKLAGITKKPVNFIIKTIYTGGIKKMWDKVAKWVGLGPMPEMKPLAAGGTVGDGWGKATPGIYNKPTAIVGEGRSRWPEFVIPTDPKYRGRAQALHAAAGSQLMEGGGILGSIWGGIKGAAGWVGGKAMDVLKAAGKFAAGALSPAFKLGLKVVNSALKKIPGADTRMGEVLQAIPKKVADGILNFLSGKDDEHNAQGTGQWIKPVRGAKITTKYGQKGRLWSSGRHTGVDFAAPIGSTVMAVDAGRVTNAVNSGPYGLHSTISHGGGLSSLYGHMSDVAVRGGAVKQGQKIGEVGMTGNTTGPHVHLEARKNGKIVSPMPYLNAPKITGPGPGSGAQRWKGVATAVLKELGIFSKYNLNAVLKTIQKESGGNPKAVNDWDSNAQRGTPSKGLIQTIDPTFNRWAGKYRSRGPYDPYANIYAGIRYARNRYGAGWAARMARPGGYDSGGFIPPGLNLVNNGTGRPEAVFNPQQFANIATLADRQAGGFGDQAVTGTLVLDSGELMGAFSGVLRADKAATVRQQSAGRRR